MELFSEEDKIAIESIRKLIRESKDMGIKNTSQLSDDFLIRYLRGRNFDIQSAAGRLTNLAYSIQKYPELFKTQYPSALSLPISKRGYNILKNRDDKGRQIYCIRVETFDPELTSLEDMLRADLLNFWEMTHFKETQLKGIVVIVDCTGTTFQMIMALSPMLIKKLADIILGAFPTKFKGAHVINLPTFFSKIVALIKAFIPRKLGERIYVHGKDLKSLHERISPDILPEWAGGNLSENEAYNRKIFDELLTPEKDEWYKTHFAEI